MYQELQECYKCGDDGGGYIHICNLSTARVQEGARKRARERERVRKSEWAYYFVKQVSCISIASYIINKFFTTNKSKIFFLKRFRQQR